MALSLEYLRQRAESLLAVATFGASSVYWLGLALTMSAAEYGSMMILQAAVLLVVAVFTFRTHDLVHFLISKADQPTGRSWRIGLGVELGAAAVCTVCATLGAWTFTGTPAEPRPEQIAIFAALAALSVAQGATVAKLRHLDRDERIVWAGYACLVAWIAVGAAVLVLPEHRPVLMLILGAAPQAVRTLVLLACSTVKDGAGDDGRSRPAAAMIARYLAGGQLINVVKNGATSIETMVLAAFAPPAVVALFRLAKSTLGAPSAASNVAVQRAFVSVAKAADSAGKVEVWRRMTRGTVRLCLVFYPISAAFALLYGLQKPDISVLTFELITAGVFVVFVPSLLLQGPFVILSVEGSQGAVNRAYIFSFVIFMAGSLLLFAVPSIWVFLAALLVSSLARQVLLERSAKAVLATDAHTEE